MEEILNKFEAYLLTERCLALNTFSAYKSDIRQFVGFLKQQNVILHNANLTNLKAFLLFLKKENITAHSMSRKISSLKSFFAWAHDTLTWENHAKDLTFPKLEKKLPHYLSEQEVQELFAVADSDASDMAKRNKVMLYLLYVSGLRITEMTSLICSAIRFDTGCLEVLGKGGKSRIVPLPSTMMTMLRDYLDTVHKKFMENHETTEYLFPTVYAGALKPISRQSFWAILKELCKKTSIKRAISPHSLRHSLATHLLKNGANLRSLQLLLGHENIATVQIYTHVEVSYLRKIYDKKHPRS